MAKKTSKKLPKTPHPKGKNLRSQLWFDNPENPGMTALYLERYMNFGLTPKELRSGKPIIGIAQTGSDLSPCNRHHLELAQRVREGIREAGGIAFEFPVHPIQETGKRPTAALDRNLAYLGLVEILYGYPLDGVVLTTGCDKTTPACIMAAATVNIPGDRALRRADAERLVEGRALRLRHGGVEGARGNGGRPHQPAGVRRHRGGLRALGRPLQHHGHGLDHERARRGARHVAAGMRRDPGALQGARADRLRDRPARGRDGVGGPQALRHSHARGVREHHHGELGDRRLDQRADPHQRDRAPHRREADHRGLGNDRLRRPAAGQHAAGRKISRRGILPRGRLAGGDERAAQGRAPAREARSR